MFSDKELIFTAETTPDLSMDLESSVNKIIPLVGLADAVNITDSPNGKTKLSSILVAAEIKRKGLDVILQLTGRDRNRIAIESEIMGAASIDINKVLCLTGDQPSEESISWHGSIEICKTSRLDEEESLGNKYFR